jgi:quercetin dioxygenase-like cupin family protein
MFFAGKWNESFADDGAYNYGARAEGYVRCSLVGRHTGAVHTELGICKLTAGGRVDRHVHSFEQCAYVLAGKPVVEIGAQRLYLAPGDYALFPVAAPHTWQNPDGEEVLWLELSSPQPLGTSGARGHLLRASARASSWRAS